MKNYSINTNMKMAIFCYQQTNHTSKTIFSSLIFLVLLLISACATQQAYYHGPYIDNGGRTEAIAIHPTNEKIIYVASSSGGLFRSVDAGASWQHVYYLPSYAVTDVEFSPDDPKILIATAAVGFAANTTGGIWRSDDGGFSWIKPNNANALESARCPKRNGAYSVSFEPGTKNVYVATDCGVAISQDRGLNWTHKVLDNKIAVNKDSTQNRQLSIQAVGNNRVWSGGEDGVWYSSDNGKKWNKSSPVNLKGRGPHAFAASPYDSRFGFMIERYNHIYQTTDGGQSWTSMGEKPNYARPPFVRTAFSVSGKQKEFDLYFGDGITLKKKTYKQENNSIKAISTTWSKVGLNHVDPCDIAFHHNKRDPYIAASDGGLHFTKDKGKNWSWMGGGLKGYGALQITEITGQFLTSTQKLPYLYFGTQDNDVWASSDGGNTWPNKLCCEGFYIRVPRFESNLKQTRVTGVAGGASYNFISEAGLKKNKGWNNPPDGDSKNDFDGWPFLIRKDHYYQVAIDQDHAPSVRKIMFTDSTGKNWKPTKATTKAHLYNRPQISSPSQNKTKIYHSVIRNTFTPKGDKVYGLVRIEDIYKNKANVYDADGTGFGSIGIFTTMFAWYPVFAVHPENPDYLIAADVQHGYMTISGDGGKTWKIDKKLTALVTDNGKYLFGRGRFSLVTNISFDPDRPCRIMIGTRQNGAFYTVNGGLTWKAVSGAKDLYNISSFFFAGKTVYMSTYGRGLFKLDIEEGDSSCTYVQLPKGSVIPDTTIVVKPKSGEKSRFPGIDALFCDDCTIALASESHMTDIQIEDGGVSRVGIAGGSLIHLKTGRQPVPIPFEVFLSKRRGEFSGDSLLNEFVNGTLPIRGLVLRENEIEAVIIGTKPIVLEEFPPAVINLQAESGTGTEFVPAGQSFFLYGTNYSPMHETGHVVIFINGEVVFETETDEEGGFVVPLMPELNVGTHHLVAIQETPTRFISAETDLQIVVNEGGD